MSSIKITINGEEFEAEEGATILDVTLENKIDIPTICYNEYLEVYGGCRLCIVEIEERGRRSLKAACTYPVSDGMIIETDSENVHRSRKLTVELLLARCPEEEIVQDMAKEYGLGERRFKEGDDNCLLCGLCVRMCQRMKREAINFQNRGYDMELGTPYMEPSLDCITCGACNFICPTSRFNVKKLGRNSGNEPILKTSKYEEGLKQEGNIALYFAQAVPNVPVIDRENCVYYQEGGCQVCSEACKAGAIDYEQEDEEVQLDVGSVILSPGFQNFDASLKGEYGYGLYDNVVSSIEFERIMSASGPFEGHILRLSDHKTPKRVAFLQCVGSRDASCDREFCSSVCCMYSIKEAIIAAEHTEGLKSKIFYMDMRAFGKEFDDYQIRAQDEYGIQFVKSRVAGIEEEEATKNLVLTYEEGGDIRQEEFDMVVLAVGFEPPREFLETAKKIGIDVNDYGFCKTDPFAPLDSNKEGVFVSGAFSSPKDIPDTVAQASGAASRAASIIHSARNTLVEKQEYPPEKDVDFKRPRIGAFICHCGINIGGVVDVPAVVEYAKTLKNVEYAEHNLYTCSQDTQEKIKEMIEEHDLNRVVVASCSPRTHEPLFRATLRQGGLNQYLFELANIRDHCSWVHMHEPAEATVKAMDLVRMAVSKARKLEPLEVTKMDIDPKALVVGGGIAGMTSAKAMATQGIEVFLVERESELGGNANHIVLASDMKEVKPRLDSIKQQVMNDPNITVMLGTSIKDLQGFVGNFTTTLETPDGEKVIEHGAVVMTTGGKQNTVTEYGDDVITQHELEEKLDTLSGNRFVMIQCAGSREAPKNYCSRFCCTQAVKNALRIKRQDPTSEVYVLYRDIRTYGFNELLYKETQELGVKFIRYDVTEKPKVEGTNVTVHDCVYGIDVEIETDHVVLSVGVAPHEENEQFSQWLKVPLSKDGFFLEAHMKLRPVEFATDGVYLAGLAHWPKSIDESISQAEGAASRALTLLTKDYLEFEGIISEVDEEFCVGCGMCVDACPYHAIDLIEAKGKAKVNAALCKGCGVCAATCRMGAVQQKNFKDQQIIEMIKGCFDEEVEI